MGERSGMYDAMQMQPEGTAGIRVVELELPEDEGEGLGFRLTRTQWDPYPWVREVTEGTRAYAAGLAAGDCLLHVDDVDLLGLPIGQVAGLIRGEGSEGTVVLRVWSCGRRLDDEPELLWSCGGGAGGERARRALDGVLRALSCTVCAGTAARPLSCARSHLYCDACWSRLQRCALCRETLPPKDSAYAKNLVAEQVFEAIANEYKIKDPNRRPTQTLSAYSSPVPSPTMSPAPTRRGRYQIPIINRNKKTVQFNDRFGQNYASDPNIHRSASNTDVNRPLQIVSNSTNIDKNCQVSNSSGNICGSQHEVRKSTQNIHTQTNQEEKSSESKRSEATKNKHLNQNVNCASSLQNLLVAHQLVSSYSLADLSSSYTLSRSLNNICHDRDDTRFCDKQTNSRDSLKNNCGSIGGLPIVVMPAPPIYVINCDGGPHITGHNEQSAQ